MDNIFKDYDFIFAYIDDILILSDDITMLLQHLNIFIDLFLQHGFGLSKKKSKLIQDKIEFLGMIIDGNGIQLQNHILEKISNFANKLIDKKQSHRRNTKRKG